MAMSAAAVVAVVVVAVAVIVVAVIMMMPAPTALVAAAAVILRQELAVQTVLQFGLGSIPHTHDLTLEIQSLTGHRMIEIHIDRILQPHG